MAFDATIGGNGELFVGEDKSFTLEVLQPNADGSAPDDTSVPVNITGWGIIFDVRKTDTSADPAIFSKNATIIGVYNATRALNTQRAFVSLTDDEMNTVKKNTYRHSWKRTDAGLETVLARGNFIVEKATAP